MKILLIVLLSLTVLMMGCSPSSNRMSSLWHERQMDDNQRIHGNPYENRDRLQSIWLSTLY
jgi:hypothetical protein